MYRSHLLGVALAGSVLLLSTTALVSADDLLKEQVASEVTITASGDIFDVTTINRRYETDVMASTKGDGPEILYQLLLIEESHVSREGPQAEPEAISTKVKVTAYPLSKSGKGAAKFTIAADGDEAKASGPYLTVTRWGCCVEEPAHAVYSLESGAFLFSATGPGDSGQWATMGAHGGWTNERIFAYHAAETAADDAVLKGAPNAVVAISYATTTQPLQRILVTVPKEMVGGDAVLNWAPKLELVSKEQPDGTDRIFVDRDGDAKDLFSNVTLRLTLDESSRIEIPLAGDRLKVDGAKLPKGFALVEVGVAP